MTSCYCEYDGEAPSVYRQTKHTARQEHRCSECGSTIRAGERYEATFGIWEGDISRFKTCERCVSFRDWLEANTPCLCWAHGNLLDDIRGHLDEIASDLMDEAPGVLFAAGRRYVRLRERARADRAERKAARAA
jgi:hypothetical protein